MWDEDDHLGRWIQGICAVLLILFILVSFYTPSSLGYAVFVVDLACARLAWRCAYYAITGRKNINRDNY